MWQVPLLILGDSPSAPTGLGRIGREVTHLINEHLKDVFRVAHLGFGGPGSRNNGYMQYSMAHMKEYVALDLPQVWRDFAGEERGIVLTMWNASWLWWLAQPEKLPDSTLKDFLLGDHFDTWGYFPVDGCTEAGTLPQSIADIMLGFDRVLAYTPWSAEVISKSIGRDVENLPHGIDQSIFHPLDRKVAREMLVERVTGLKQMKARPEAKVIGVVATNTPRKDWYLAFETCYELLKYGMDIILLAHTDAPKKAWDLLDLQERFGMQGRVLFSTNNLNDEDMAWVYSACDVTLGIGSGEGWGMILSESLACGVPVVHGNYAAGAEFVPKVGLVDPVGFRGDGIFAIRRPVFRAEDWAKAARRLLKAEENRRVLGEDSKYPLATAEFHWSKAWPRWQQWLLKGVE